MILSFMNSNCSNSSNLINLNKALLAWCKSYIIPLPPHLVPTSIAFHFFFFFYFTFSLRILFLAFSSFHETGLGARGFNWWNVTPMEIRKERTIVLTKELRNMEVGRKRERERKKEKLFVQFWRLWNANSSIQWCRLDFFNP